MSKKLLRKKGIMKTKSGTHEREISLFWSKHDVESTSADLFAFFELICAYLTFLWPHFLNIQCFDDNTYLENLPSKTETFLATANIIIIEKVL